MSAHLSRLCLLALGIFFSTSGLGQTATEAALQSGGIWLEARVQADGRVEFEDAAIALPDQTRTETALALRALDALPLSLRDAITASAADATESKARRALVLAVAGSADASAAGQVEAMQNADGGYGAFVGRQSSVLDTAWALQALARSSSADAGKASRALGWLVAAKLPDGGFGENGQSDSYTTAHVLLAANAWSSRFATGALSGAARNFLLAHRDASGGFGETYMDAAALLALAGVTADATILGPLQDRLIQQQGQDGSWSSDPYQTALALRALQLITAPPTAPATASLGARIIDDATNAPIEGVLAQIVETPNASLVTGADGVFTLDGMAVGSATLRISRLGYERLDFALNLVAGQTLRMGDIRLRAAPLTATISGVVRNVNGQALANAVVAVGTASVLTNTSGAYELSGIPSGSAMIGVSLPNYRSVSQDLVLDAGQRYTFSPTLFFISQTPPATATLRGKVIDAQSSLPVTGANVTVAGATKATLADGKFEFTDLGVGAFTLSISAPAYDARTVTGSVVAGVNDVGTIAMTRTPTTSTLVGSVVDAMSGAPIAGATLVVQGQTATALSGPDGRYSLSGIQGTGLTLVTTAPGFLSNTLQIGLPQVGTNTLDIPLTALQDVGIRISNVATNKPVYLPSEELELEIEVISVTAAPVEMIVSAEVRNESGDVVHTFKANPQGLGDDPPNQPISFAPNSLRELELDWMLARQPAGIYTIHAIGTDSNGRVLAEGTTRFTLDAAAVLAGGVIANPPLVQVGTGTPVHLSAELTNFGNLPIPAGDVKLQVILENADTQTSTVPRVGVTQAFGGAPLNIAQDMVRGPDGDYFVLNSGDRNIIRITPQNVASVFVALPTAGSGPSLAITNDGTLFAASSGRSLIYKVSSGGVISSITPKGLSQVLDLDVASDGTIFANGIFLGEIRLLRIDASGVESLLWQGGMAAGTMIAKAGDGSYVITSSTDNALYKLAPGGRLARFVSGLKRPAGIVADGNGNFYVTQLGDNTVVKVSAGGVVTPFANGLNDPRDIKLDAQGNVFVANFGSNTISKIAADGGKEVYTSGIIQSPTALRYDENNNLYAVGLDGFMRKKSPSGAVSVVTTGLSDPRGLALLPDGSQLVAGGTSGAVTKVSGGIKTTLAGGLASPRGVAADDSGRIAVTESSASQLTLLSATGNVLEKMPTMVDKPRKVIVGNADTVFVSNFGFVTAVNNGVPSRFGGKISLRQMAFHSASGALASISDGGDLQWTSTDGVTSRVKNIQFIVSGLAVDATGEAVLLDGFGRRLVRITHEGVETVLALFSLTPSALVSDREGNLYVQLGTNSLYRVAADGTATLLAALPVDRINAITATADGALLVSASNKSLLVDTATGIATQLPTLPIVNSSIVAESMLSDGSRVVVSNVNEIVVYSPLAIETSRITAFVAPNDIVWTGNEYVFNDGNGDLFNWIPGQYPHRLTRNFGTASLSYANHVLLGSDIVSIFRWVDGVRLPYMSVTGARFPAVAVRADGGFAGADLESSRVMEFDATKALTGDFVGVAGPISIAFAPDGGLMVANANTATIIKIAGAGAGAQKIASIGNLEYIAFDADGKLWVVRQDGVARLRNDGVAETQSFGVNLHGLLFDGAAPIAVGRSDGTVRRWDGSDWRPIASSLTRGPIVLDANDRPVIVSESNRTLSRFENGDLVVVASGIPVQPLHVALVEGDGFVVTGFGGSAALIDAQGLVQDLRTETLLDRMNIYAAVFDSASTGRLLVEKNANDSRIYDLNILQVLPPPGVGTVVHEVLRAMPESPVTEVYTAIDFGEWLPAFGGDFKVVTSRDDVAGTTAGFVHVGPSADAQLTATRETLPPGDQSARMCLELSGADFTSLSRVEVSRIRPLVTNSRPNGMAADREGNIYFTTSTSLNRIALDGSSKVLATGLRPTIGLAIDDSEILYFANRNAVSGKVDLMRAGRDGSVSLFLPLNVAAAAGVAVDRMGNVLVGTAEKLLKVSPAGVLTQTPSTGLPSPRGITIDGRDNVYVQNENNLVSMIRPDGATFVLFSGTGRDDPIFEGDGFPNITADCADNVYIAPGDWARINQVFEEHTLAQIIPQTGQVGTLFDGARVSPQLGDIDYLAFDRFGSRILMWEHFALNIWQVPVTCGAIGVEAHLTTLPGQVLSGMSRGPSAVVDLPGGSKEYVWSLRDVTAAGEAVCFDAPQSDLQLGELRQTLASGFMEFQNSFAPDNVRVPIAVPSIRVDDLVAITVATDRAEYRANERVAITTGLLNSNVEPVSAALSVRVLDAHGAQVALVATQGVDLPATGQTSAAHEFAVANLLPGQYRVVSELSQADRLVASASVDFMVLADDAPSSVSSRLATDKQVYDAGERVTILSRASNLSANVVRENLSLRIVVLDAGGATLTTYSHFVSQLLPGASRDFSQAQQLGNVPAGAYRVEQQLLDADNRVLDFQAAAYQVRSGAESGVGVAGAVDATPNDVLSGAVAALNATIRNDGNVAIAALPVQVAVIDVQTQSVLASWPETLDLGLGAQRSLVHDWNSARVPAGEYLAVLSASFGGVDRVLAQDTLQVAKPDVFAVVSGTIVVTPETPMVGEPVQMDATLLNAGSVPLFDLPVRVQVLAADGTEVASWTRIADVDVASSTAIQNLWDSTDAVEGEYRVRLSLEIDGVPHTLGEQTFTLLPASDPVKVETSLTRSSAARVLVLVTCHDDESEPDDRGNASNDDDDDEDEDEDGCAASRATFLDSYLTDAGVAHRIVTSTDDFGTLFRSGRHNVYWISGGADKLENVLAEEVREAVFRGDGLIIDGNHDSRNKILDEALGVKHVGQLARNDHSVVVGGNVFANITFVGRGDAMRYELKGGMTHATFDSASGSPALVSNAYGRGHALGFAFGLASTLMHDSASSDLRRLLLTSVGLVSPAVDVADPAGGFVALAVELRNVGSEADVDLVLTVDAPVAIESTDPSAETANATTAVWKIHVIEGEHRLLVAGVRLPGIQGLATVRLTALRRDTDEVLAESELQISARDMRAVRDDLVHDLSALAVSSGKERSARDNALSSIAHAVDAAETGRWGAAFEDLLKARDQLVRITSISIAQPHTDVARLLRAVELRWFAAGASSHPDD